MPNLDSSKGRSDMIQHIQRLLGILKVIHGRIEFVLAGILLAANVTSGPVRRIEP